MKINTRRLATDAMLCAMCAVLGYVSIDMGNIKITLEALPVMLCAMMLGPMDGMIVGGFGTLIYQLLRYGISPTTVLWILPYLLCGLIMGAVARQTKYSPGTVRTVVLAICMGLMITALNTGALYVDSIIFGYYNPVYIFGTLMVRIVIQIVESAAFGLILPVIIRALRPVVSRKIA